ncbi:MAG: hypothetical protein WAQ28_15930 [Bacteroidia bacterium]
MVHLYFYNKVFVKKVSLIALAALVLFSACSTDLSVIGDYKETMVIYGLLDQSQSKQYIKINKAFLGEGSALAYAQVKDSTQYVNALTVTLKRIKNGVELSSYSLTPDNTIPKNPGTFYAPDQQNAIYSFSTPSGTLNTDSEYELTVKNSETGITASAKTILITDATYTAPVSTTPFFNFILAQNNDYTYPVRWQTGKNARLYQLIIRFNYIDSTTTGNVTQKLDWVFPAQKTTGLSGGETMKNDFLGQGFLQFVGNQLDDYTGLVSRTPLNVDLLLIAGGDDLSTFIDVNKPSTSIVQEKPEYTNISNGLGIFSSRYSKAPFSKPLGKTSRDSLACGQYTQHLKFLDYLGNVCQ